MAEIFLSYARSDEGKIEALSEALKQVGYTVWWDREIDGGTQFSEHIEEQLAKARAVIVAWSQDSVHSRWVRDEASIALDDSKLISISLDGSPPPIGFKQIHTINMTGPRGMEDLQRALSHQLEKEAVEHIPDNASTEASPKSRRPNWVAAAIAGSLAIGIPVAITLSGSAEAPLAVDGATAPTVLAVMPFSVSGDAEWQDIGTSLTSSLSSNLARLSYLRFVSDTSVRAVAKQGLSAAEIGQRLGVDHFVEGDVRASGEQLVASVRLVSASDGRAVWSGDIRGETKYSDEYEALLLNRLSGILRALHSVANGEVDIPKGIDPRAYEAFLDGSARITARNWESFPQALSQLQLAAAIEPDFAAAHATMALAMGIGSPGSFSMSRDEFLALGEGAIGRALALDSDNFTAKLAQGHIALQGHGDVAGGMRIADELLALRPTDPLAHGLKALALGFAGRPSEAIMHLDNWMAADPYNFMLHFIYRATHIRAGNYLAVRRSVLECRIDCWNAAWQWWEALLKIGTPYNYRQDFDQLARMAEDDRAFWTGEESITESLGMHARFIVMGEDAEHFILEDDGDNWGLNTWTLVQFKYEFVDQAFVDALRNLENAPGWMVMNALTDDRLTPSKEIRADPRYHRIFGAPQYKAIADYRRAQGLTAGLPVFPVKPYKAH